MFFKKKSELKSLLCTAMDYKGLCAPVLIKMADGASNWVNFCCAEFPAEIFSASTWTPSMAFEQGFLTEGMKSKLETDPSKWKDFNLIITSNFNLEEATAKLVDKIPHYDKLAILEVDPDSIAKGEYE